MDKIAIFGCGGHALSLSDAILSKKEYDIAGYVDKELGGFSFDGKEVIATDDKLSEILNRGINYGAIGIGSIHGGNAVRWNVYKKGKKEGLSFPVISDATAIISKSATVGNGTFIGKGAIVNVNSIIGECSIINTRAVIEHSVKIGDNTHISIGTIICGDASIGNNCMIGAGAVILQGVKIGNNVTVGAGAIVLHDIEDGKTVVGNPAREIK